MMLRCAIAWALMCGAAHAQEPPAPPAEDAAGRIAFTPDYFDRFAPQTALDMVRHVPGFSIDEGGDRRGFAGAAGNVLIDGARPTSKSQDLEDLLARIPAGHVERIDLIRDAGGSADAAGQTVLIDVVRRDSAGSGVWRAEFEGSARGRISPRGEASWSGRAGTVDYALGVSRYLEYRPLDGDRTFRDGAGALIAAQTDQTPRTFRDAGVTGEASWPFLGGSLRVNAAFGRQRFATILGTESFTPAGDFTGVSTLAIEERERRREVGVNYSRDVGPFALEAIALATQRRFARDDDTVARDAAGVAGPRVLQAQRREPGETLGRVRLSWPLAEGHRLDFGGEAALNTLETRLSLSEGGVARPLPAANVSIEEVRGEAFALYAWRPNARWSLEAQAAVESSRLEQTGDTTLTTELVYWKPSLQATRTIGARQQLRVRVWRDVDQLDFDDFASAAELADNRVAAGNPNLRPESSWRAEAQADLRFGADGAASLTVFQWDIEDAADVVPVGPPGQRFDAPGNIGDGRVRGATLTATLPLGRVLPGARLTLEAANYDTAVDDPVTGVARAISGFSESRLEAEFRHDLPAQRVAWGAAFYKEAENVTYRLGETDTYEEGPFVDLWIETTAVPGLKITAFANAVQDSPFRRERRFFTPDRAGALTLVERRERQFGRFYGLRVTGAFG